MSLVDHWYLHRERLLVAVGVLLGAGSFFVAMNSASADPNFRAAWSAGVATRGIVLGVIIASVGHWLIERFYWRDSSARLRLPPECAAIAGVIALAMSLFLIPNITYAGEPVTKKEFVAAAGCDDPGPVASMPVGSYVEIGAKQSARLDKRSLLPELADVTTHYAVGDRREASLVSVIGIGEENISYPEYFEDFQQGLRMRGETPSVISIAGRDAIQTQNFDTMETAIYVPVGCNIVSVIGGRPDSVMAHAEAVFGS